MYIQIIAIFDEISKVVIYILNTIYCKGNLA